MQKAGTKQKGQDVGHSFWLFSWSSPKEIQGDHLFKNEPKPRYLRRTHQYVAVKATQDIANLKMVVSMEPRCSHCGSPKYLRHLEGWKGCGKPVLAGLVCVWCGCVERAVYVIGESTREDHEK